MIFVKPFTEVQKRIGKALQDWSITPEEIKEILDPSVMTWRDVKIRFKLQNEWLYEVDNDENNMDN